MTTEQRAVVTGASEGIGRAFAVRLAKEGYSITAVARNEERLKELTSALGDGAGHRYLVADLATEAGVAAVQADLAQTRCHLLVNNAGFGKYGPFAATELSLWQGMIRVNIEALVSLAHGFLAQAERGDALINTSSVVSFLPMANLSIYSATKAFVTSFSESLWYEEKEKGVYVMALCPGPTATHFHERASVVGKESRKPPDFLVQSAEEVVAETMAVLARRRQPTMVSGLANRITTLARHLPRRQLSNLLGNAVR